MRCSIDTLPPEIVSEILIEVIKSFGEAIRLKWQFPLLIRRVSRRFYHITTNTQSLWRYLYIDESLHPYLQNHILHSGRSTLEVDITFHMFPGDHLRGWTEITDLILPLCPRLATLFYNSLYDSEPITKILQSSMPILESLCIGGLFGFWAQVALPGSRFPRLRSLRSEGLFSFGTGMRLAERLEELDLRGWRNREIHLTAKFWRLLPTNIRILHLEPLIHSGVRPNSPIIHLPCLTELNFNEHRREGELSILQFLDAPVLRTLAIESECWGRGPDNLALTVDFPVLTHLAWNSPQLLPLLNGIIRGCNTLKSIQIKTWSYSTVPGPSVSDLVATLADDTTLLPLLEDIWVYGASTPTLIRLVQARPCLKSVKVRYDGVDDHYSGEQWVERRGWLESQSAVQISVRSI